MTFEVTDVLALISGADNVGDQWRCIRPYYRLGQAGINARWYGLDTANDAYLRTDPERTVLVVRLMTGDSEAAIDRWLAERRPKVRTIVYEMDDVAWGDAMVEHLKASNFTQGRPEAEIRHQGEMARYLASRCDGVIVSTEPLAELVRSSIGGAVVTLPNAIDTRWFRCQMAARAPWAREGRVTIGWLGGHRPEADVAMMARAWGRIARRYPHVRFVVAAPVVPDVFYREIEDESVIFRHGWTDWQDVPVLFQVDIGCCAVADTPFSRAKSPIKAWEYATAGAAVAATPTLYGNCVGPSRLVESADEWENILSFLIEHPRERQMIAQDAVRHVERHHSLDGQLHRWPEAYGQIVDARSGVTV